jgi:hypothetical protein
MRLREITSITGLSGLFKMEVQRPDGMIVTSLTEKWTKFIPSRTHGFTPLENIAIYTDTDTVPLSEVLLTMRKVKDKTPMPAAKASADAFKAYMETILPEYDREKVYVSDMKKLVRWYEILDEHGVIEEEAKAAEAGEKADGEPVAETKPAVKQAASKSSGSKAADQRTSAAKGGGAMPGVKTASVPRAGKSRNKTD